MSLLRHIERVNRWDPARFRPLLLGAARVGRIRNDFAPALAAFPAVFAVADDAVRLVPADPEALTAAVGLATRRLVADGLVPMWRNEWFDVMAGDGETPLFRVDRGVLPRLGVRAGGLHLNGFVRRDDGLHLWIAKRAPDKALDPDKLDNMVAGGIAAGHGPWSTLLKEGEEEAALPPDLLARARPAGIVTYVMERQEGLRDDLLYVYDLEMPESVSAAAERRRDRRLPADAGGRGAGARPRHRRVQVQRQRHADRLLHPPRHPAAGRSRLPRALPRPAPLIRRRPAPAPRPASSRPRASLPA
jgi:hypothetical protein